MPGHLDAGYIINRPIPLMGKSNTRLSMIATRGGHSAAWSSRSCVWRSLKDGVL